MLADRRIIVGLDVGTTKTCCIICEILPNSDKINVIGTGSVESNGLEKGLVVDLNATTQSIYDAVRKARRRAGDMNIDSVVVGITGEHVTSQNSRVAVAITSPTREITQEDINRVIESSKSIVLLPDREIVQAIPRQFIVDGLAGIKSPLNMFGNRLEVETHIITSSKSFVENLVSCVERAGLDVEATILEPIATADAVLTKDEKDMGAVVVDIGGGTSDIAMYINGEIYYTSVIPVGGKLVTNDIAVGLRASREEAERCKIEYGYAVSENIDEEETFEINTLGVEEPKSLQKKYISSIIEARMQELFELIKLEIKKTGRYDMLSAGVVLTGGGALIAGADKLAAEIFDLPVRIGYPKGLGGLADTVSEPKHATVVGLVLHWSKAMNDLQDEGTKTSFASEIMAVVSDWVRRIFRPGL